MSPKPNLFEERGLHKPINPVPALPATFSKRMTATAFTGVSPVDGYYIKSVSSLWKERGERGSARYNPETLFLPPCRYFILASTTFWQIRFPLQRSLCKRP